MSKSRGNSEPLHRRAEEDQSSSGAHETEVKDPRNADWAITLGVAAGGVAYLAIFFSTSPARLLVIAHLLMPDELIGQWAEGRWSQAQFFDRWPILLCGLAILLGCYFMGRVVLWLTRLDSSLTTLDRIVLSLGIGLHLQSLLTLLGGLIAIPISPLMFVPCWMISAGSVLLLWWLGKLRYEPDASALSPFAKAESEPLSKLALAASWSLRIYIGICSLAIWLGAMLPPVDFDVREYHLQVPKEWSERGAITFLPHNVYGNMPLGAELHSLAATQLMPRGERPWWWGALAGKFIMASYGPLTALAVYSMGRRFLSPLAGLSAAAIYVSSPWVVHVCINGLNEAVLGFYLVTAMYVLLINPQHVRSFVLGGFLAGAAASCKYTGVVFVVLPLAFLAIFTSARFPRGNIPKGLSTAAVLLVVTALSCGLWYGKNWVLAGNPTYPLHSGIFAGKSRTPEKDAQWSHAHRPPAFAVANLAKSAQHVLWKSNFHDPLAVPLAAMGVVGTAVAVRNRIRSRKRETELLWASHLPFLATAAVLAFFLIAWWLFTHRLDRFLVPAIPLAALVAGAGVECARKKPLPYIVAGLMVVGLTYNLLAAASPFVGDNRWFVSLERLRTDEPQTDQQISRVKAAHRWLNQHVKPGQAVLCVSDAGVFDLEMSVYYNTCFDDCLLVNWTEGKTPEQRRTEFRSRQIAYVYFDEDEFNRYIGPGNYGYDSRFSPRLLDELVRQGILKPPLPEAPPGIYPVAP